MKTYAAALVRETKRSRGLKGFLISQKQDAGYYYAENEAECITAMWIEAWQLGKCIAYPCLLTVKDDIMSYTSSAATRENTRLMNAWNVFMKPSEFSAFKYQKLSQDDFYAKLESIRQSYKESERSEE